MYTIYEEHIEILEGENNELQKQVMALRRRIKYYQAVMQEEEDDK